MSQPPVSVNGRDYAWPVRPVVVICIDGCDPAYIEAAVAAGVMPWLAGMLERGSDHRARGAMPSFTNPNNLSIVTGCPPSVHGICGNFFHDPETGRDVMMDDPRFLRAPTILQAFHDRGARVAVVTAKDKLRRLLGCGLETATGRATGRAICFSSEKADQTTMDANGIADAAAWIGRPVPAVYSGELSHFVLACGVKLLAEFRPDLLYLSTSDYIQHSHAPGTPVANGFYAELDHWLARMDAAGAVLALTADHGMSAKHDAAGNPDVIFLQDILDRRLGRGTARVILPITDPYVAHHGALGSFATVCLPPAALDEGLRELARLDGVLLALPRDEAAARFELPADRIGELVVVSGAGKVLGTGVDAHDLSALQAPLRSHGGLSEQRVPLLLNRPTPGLAPGRQLRNFDAFDLALNAAIV